MGRPRILSGKLHAVRILLVTAGLSLAYVSALGSWATVGCGLGYALLSVGGIAAADPAQLKRPVRWPEAVGHVLLAAGLIASLIWAHRQKWDEWLRPAVAFLYHPAFQAVLWATLIGTELWAWRRSRLAQAAGT
jgi:hypothetical protein